MRTDVLNRIDNQSSTRAGIDRRDKIGNRREVAAGKYVLANEVN